MGKLSNDIDKIYEVLAPSPLSAIFDVYLQTFISIFDLFQTPLDLRRFLRSLKYFMCLFVFFQASPFHLITQNYPSG